MHSASRTSCWGGTTHSPVEFTPVAAAWPAGAPLIESTPGVTATALQVGRFLGVLLLTGRCCMRPMLGSSNSRCQPHHQTSTHQASPITFKGGAKATCLEACPHYKVLGVLACQG
eukprot:1151352-Pelagomonas_calceolata.AAC.4